MVALALLALVQEPPGTFPLREKLVWTFESKDGKRNRTIEKEKEGTWLVRDQSLPEVLERAAFRVSEKGIDLVRALNDLETPALWLKLPLKKGQKWAGRLDAGKEPEMRGRLSFEVMDKEEVKVPAGRFEAWRVRLVLEGSDGSRVEIETWYAKGAGPVQRAWRITGRGGSREQTLKLARLMWGNEQLFPRVGGAWSRESGGCECKEENPFEECRCLHCVGEEGSKCYCGTGCRCGREMPECSCRHCTGLPGGDDGKGGCGCSGD